jgi:hypothetical protein
VKTTTTVVQWIIRITGLIQLVLGIFIWTGKFDNLIGIHTLDGLIFVVALVVMSVLAAVARVQPGMAAVGVVWAVVVLLLGLTQQQLLPGPAHWVIQIIHLLLGVGAIGLGETLARRTQGRLAQPAVAR